MVLIRPVFYIAGFVKGNWNKVWKKKKKKFQYFWDFNKCIQAVFFQLSFEHFWLYHLGASLLWLKIIKNYYKSALKVCKWISSLQMHSKMLSQINKGSLISVSSKSSKIYLWIKVLYGPIWFNLWRQYFLFHALNASLCY